MSQKLTVLDTFAGIGGFSLGLEMTGHFETIAFCENEPYAQAVLKKHWPDVPLYEDIHDVTAERCRADGIIPNVITGGFPCQDISNAGKREGIRGERSGLWSELHRVIGDLEPELVILENVSALLGRGVDVVLGDLAEIGYDAEWHCITASAVGAPHQRDRVWIVAYSNGGQQWQQYINGEECEAPRQPPADGTRRIVADPGRFGRLWGWLQEHAGEQGASGSELDRRRARRWRYGKGLAWETEGSVVNPLCSGRGEWRPRGFIRPGERCRAAETILFPGCQLSQRWRSEETDQFANPWTTEPDVGRVAHGVPARVDRLRCLGNAVVPQIPFMIGNAIWNALESENGWEDQAGE